MTSASRRARARRDAELAGRSMDIVLARGRPARRMSVLDALREAESRREARDFAGAALICSQLTAPGLAEPRLIMLRTCMDLGMHRPALELAEQLRADGIDDPPAVETVCRVLRQCLRHGPALELLDGALRRYPDESTLHRLRAVLHAETGDTGRAVTELRAAADADPEDFAAFRYLSNLGELTAKDMDGLERAHNAQPGSADIGYALASAYRKRDDIENEMRCLKLANAADGTGSRWDAGRERARLARLESLCDAAFLEARRSAARRDRRLLLIVGMPRSGSTLIERILSSHDSVESVGESMLLDDALNLAMRSKPGTAAWPDSLAELGRGDLEQAAARYWQDVDAMYTDARIVVDKSLDNDHHLGLILAMFPEAVVVHVTRHPLAICLSCFQRALDAGYSHNLADIAQRYTDHMHLMAHWAALFEKRILNVRYEALVTDFEAECRRLLTFCGLRWNDDVLDFHRSAGVVTTASSAQVRHPLYPEAAQNWRRYEKHLQPAIDALAGPDGAGRE